MFKHLGSLLSSSSSRKRVMMNKSSITTLLHFQNHSAQQSTTNYHDREFATFVNTDIVNTLATPTSKEQLVKQIAGIKNMVSSPAFEKTTVHLALDELNKKIKENQREFPDKALPTGIFNELVQSTIRNFSFYTIINRTMEKDEYELIENLDEMKRQAIYVMLNFSTFNGLLIKGIFQEWFSFEDLKNLHVLLSSGIDIEGKDLVLHDQVTYYSAITELLLREFVNIESVTTREKLMCMVNLICLELGMNLQNATALMHRFIELYPVVKQKYTTPSEGDIDKSWTDILEKVYSEDEFDWYHDLETDLPIHLGGMYNIFQEFVKDGSMLKVFEEESKRAPKNPYIPYVKLICTNDISCTTQCLNILANSQAPSRMEDLKRMELFEIFKNKKPHSRIKDFKFFPQILARVKYLCINEAPSLLDSTMLLDQVEYYSRVPTHVDLIVTKCLNHLRAGRLEEALQNYQVLSYYEKSIPNKLLLFITNKVIRPMIILGYENEAIEVVDKFKNKFGDEDSQWEKLLQATITEVEKRKK
ncbi:predicted protein [Naegleria gruberi]|uniref:Predicted protein n=1 Tax=Naegleria gruberi TaxID=5762 RepID=D2VMI4_NAEGR|nr:uncharacterized protein NAEGRDRAFT_70147 [Naegleria gruberi]EFC42068.1 predicted protein [Naegleria gruberi]|eukprot:XP_002674812.1 predicted protein [Naegleria gruberi strain NEG-M]